MFLQSNYYYCPLIALTLISICLCNSISADYSNRVFLSEDNESINKWVETALKFFQIDRCYESRLGPEEQCFKLANRKLSEITVWLGRSHLGSDYTYYHHIHKREKKRSLQKQKFRKVIALLPDSENENTPHDAILAFDIYPKSNFGHLVALFYITINAREEDCQQTHQIYSEGDKTCVTVARKRRCPNQLKSQISSEKRSNGCYVDFLPTVHLYTHLRSGRNQLNNILECIQMQGFSQCPKLIKPEEEGLFCDPSNTNTKRCDTSQTGVNLETDCKIFQTCDRGFLLSGSGFNRLYGRSLENVIKINKMLLESGFRYENIKTFYANGYWTKETEEKRGIKTGQYYHSTAMKYFRNHLRNVCQTKHCADTFFIYLNNPTTIDGDMLLYDFDSSGIAENNEIYRIREFLSDISQCEAKRVIILADQSNSKPLLLALNQSRDHKNVFLITAGQENQETTNGEITEIWANYSQPVSSLGYILQMCQLKMTDSTLSIVYENSGNFKRLSLAGSPCDLNPPLTKRELRLYQGCQNIATSVWFSLNFDGLTDVNEENTNDKDSLINSPNRREIV